MRVREGQQPPRKRFNSVSLVAYAPVASTPSTCLGIPSPAGGVPALVTCLGEPRFLLQGGPSSHHWARDRFMAPATRRPQPRREQKAQATAVGKWIVRRGSLLAKRQEEPIWDKGGMVHQHVVPGRGLSQPRMSSSWHKTPPCVGHIQDTPSHGRKGEVPFLEQSGGATLEKAVFRKKGERP